MTRLRKPAQGRTGARKIKPAGDSTPGPAPLDPALKRSAPRSIRLLPHEAQAQDALAERQGHAWTEMAREALALAVSRGSTRP